MFENFSAIKNTDEKIEKEYTRFEYEARKKFFLRSGKGASHPGDEIGPSGENINVGKAGFGNVFEAVEKSKDKNQFEKVFISL